MSATHCPTCGYLFDGPHNTLCAEVKGLREQVKEMSAAIYQAWKPEGETDE